MYGEERKIAENTKDSYEEMDGNDKNDVKGCEVEQQEKLIEKKSERYLHTILGSLLPYMEFSYKLN